MKSSVAFDYKRDYYGGVRWLVERTIFLTKHGSHAYGLNTPASDLDVKGVAVPPVEYFFGFVNSFEQAEQREGVDLVVYDARKFFKLASDCNPNICEVLWTEADDHLLVTDAGRMLLENRSLFISKKAKFTFSGYAIAQLKRINTHWRWLRNPPKSPPTRSEFGLPESPPIGKEQRDTAESLIKKKLDEWALDLEQVPAGLRDVLQDKMSDIVCEILAPYEGSKHVAAGRNLGFDDNFLEVLERERLYKTRVTEWKQFEEWKKTRNAVRHELEEKHGYDTKHGMHLVRLMRMCKEILQTGSVKVKRTDDREELLAIRNGAWSYDRLLEWARNEDEAMNAVYESSTLRHSPDRTKLDALLRKIIERMLFA